jgi:hypothetical protein
MSISRGTCKSSLFARFSLFWSHCSDSFFFSIGPSPSRRSKRQPTHVDSKTIDENNNEHDSWADGWIGCADVGQAVVHPQRTLSRTIWHDDSCLLPLNLFPFFFSPLSKK